MESFSSAQQQVIILVSYVPILLSIAGSSLIIKTVYAKLTPNESGAYVYERIMLGISSMDIVHTVAMAFNTFPAPAATTDVSFAAGNQTTCSIQGFFIVFGLSAFYYNGSLSLYFLLVSRYRLSEKWIQKKIEVLLHTLPLLTGISGAIVAAATQTLNFSTTRCAMDNFPKDCVYDDSIECLRGANSDRMRWFFMALPQNITLFLMILSNILIFLYTRRIEGNHHRMSLYVARIAFLYCGATVACYLWSWIIRGVTMQEGGKGPSFALILLQGIFYPLQGFFNCLVFFYRRSLLSKVTGKNTKSKTSHPVDEEAANYFDNLSQLSNEEDASKLPTEPSPW